ncbi:hypothetical protein DFH11DRAFT_1874697 [Phellopilus nigrolimitatus]|nr:hypothetical protein DFH11DRAFT_1874697 [Phellopilus nigrolimitatus]
MIDPTLCRADRLVGQVLSAVGKLPRFTPVSLFLLQHLLGVGTEDKKAAKATKLVKKELLLIDIGSTSTGGCMLGAKVTSRYSRIPCCAGTTRISDAAPTVGLGGEAAPACMQEPAAWLQMPS